jgi:endonuclease/exonuclease/phosphatase family metal-dependent hydrolase
MRLVVATYNVHGCVGSDGRYSRERILNVLKELQADLIALQEIDCEDTLLWLAEQMKLTGIAGPVLQHAGCFGNGLLTSCRMEDLRLVDLTVQGHTPRGAIDVDLHCNGNVVQVIATHLGLRPNERRSQVRALLKQFHNVYCILLGDINEWFLWGRPLRWIRAMFGYSPALRTFPARSPFFALDRIWIRPPGALTHIQVHRTHLSAVASDHLPLKGVIEW